MSTPDITPDLLRAVAAHVAGLPGGSVRGVVAAELDLIADRIEQDRRRERLVDMLTEAYTDAHAESSSILTWKDLYEDTREPVRRGIRAALAKLEALGLLQDAPIVEETLDDTYRGGDPGADPADEWDAPAPTPRAWNDLGDVPADVQHVTDNSGNRLVRCAAAPFGWTWVLVGGTFGPISGDARTVGLAHSRRRSGAR